MSEGGKQTPISPGLIARVVQSARYVISGVAPSAWFGPMQPLQPLAPPDVAGRRFDYPTGVNLNTTPRGYEPVSFTDLRALADNCDILRAVIETRKDQLESMDWLIRPRFNPKDKQKTATTDDQKRRIDQATAFLSSPDRVCTWSQWLRQLLEDRFVIDAAALYKRRDRKGRLYGLEILDGATLKVLIDDHGRRPIPPDPAYQQVLHGVPAVDYTAEEVMYLARNLRSWKVYGFSEVEQIVITVNIAIRRALFQLEYYREGSQPDAFLGLPKEWTAQQIIDFQKSFDAMMSGNLASRRKLKMVPGDAKYQETKQPLLKDATDEWLARLICFKFSISPEPFVQHTNRGTAETAHDRAVQEGLLPMQRWIKGVIDPVIALEFDSPDLEFAWEDDREMDPKQASDIRVNEVKAGIRSIDSAREDIGDEPIGGAFATPMVYTPSGYLPIDPKERAAMAPQTGQDAQHGTPGGEQESPDAHEVNGHTDSEHQKAAYTRLRKAARHKPVPFDRPTTREARTALKRAVAKILHEAGRDSAAQLRDGLGKLTKDDSNDQERAKHLAQAINLGSLNALTDAVPDELESVLSDAGGLALAQIGVGDRSDLVDQVNDRAVEYARQRAAEMIGKSWVNGELVDNPDARWRIDEATRDELQGIITQGLSDNIGWDAIADQVEAAAAFSEERADLIATTEIARANSVGALEGYKAARDIGIKVKKVWLADAEACDICQANADQGPIDLNDDFDSGDDAPPGHPRCECALTNEVEEGDEANEGGDE